MVVFSLPFGSHGKGNSYSFLTIKLADVICFRFISLTSSDQILAGNENIWLYIIKEGGESVYSKGAFWWVRFISDESSDFDSAEKPRQMLISKFMCKRANEVNT